MIPGKQRQRRAEHFHSIPPAIFCFSPKLQDNSFYDKSSFLKDNLWLNVPEATEI